MHFTPWPLLVQDRVDADGGLARLAVADDQLALAPADRRHGVDGLDAGLHRLVHRLAPGDARGLDLHAAGLVGVDRAVAVDGLAEGVDHPADQGVADGDGLDATGGPHRGALLDGGDLLALAQDHRADGLLVQVQGEADGAALELEELVDGAVGQARHAGDAVAHLEDAADLGDLEVGGVALEVLAQGGGDVRGVDVQISHGWRLPLLLVGAQERADRDSRSWARRWRTVPSMTWSPTRTTRPPTTVGSTTTRTSTSRAGGALQRRGEPLPLVLGEVDGRAHLGHLATLSSADISSSASTMSGSSRPRPAATTMEARPRVTSEVREPAGPR